ncbi:hypothetical protein [Nonomuraea sp. NPDC050310]|uniref:hypothetical protein n=1 Tax=Nonomuraea sp. NPDC050310 TaxID=3154935 RepID=UPI0033DE0681
MALFKGRLTQTQAVILQAAAAKDARHRALADQATTGKSAERRQAQAQLVREVGEDRAQQLLDEALARAGGKAGLRRRLLNGG